MNVAILNRAYQAVHSAFPKAKPFCTVILGSGLGNALDTCRTIKSLNYSEIPGLGNPGVTGHSGRLLLSEISGTQILIFQGRRHFYEAVGWEPIAIPVYISLKLDISFLILTNAAGGLEKKMRPGDLMIINDHINLMGCNPLIGNRDKTWGTLFADQSNVYDPILRKMLLKAASAKRIAITSGVYAATSGPTYETPAEARALGKMGIDAIGMSTVPEAILANAAGMKVAGISCIANTLSSARNKKLFHKDVINSTAKAQPAIRALLSKLLKDIAANVSNMPK